MMPIDVNAPEVANNRTTTNTSNVDTSAFTSAAFSIADKSTKTALSPVSAAYYYRWRA